MDALVQQATRIRNFEIVLIPGLMQTPRLRPAHHVGNQSCLRHRSPGHRGGCHRPEVRYDPGRQFEFITEAALRFRFAASEVMRGQLDRLSILSGLASIQFGIIPMGTPLPLVPLHGFLMADDITHIETSASDIILRGEESAAYERIADGLMAEAITGDHVQQLLTDAAAKSRIRDTARIR